jgi:hypothetical protein
VAYGELALERVDGVSRANERQRSLVVKAEDSHMGRVKRSSRGNGQSAAGPKPRIGRKDLPDPDRDVTEPTGEGDPG